MKKLKTKEKVLLLVSICVMILLGAVIADRIMAKSYLSEISYDEVIEKLDNKDTFVLLISQTTCSHCIKYKPKLKEVSNEYEIDAYYIDVDLLEEDDYNELISRLSLGKLKTPLTIFLRNGEETTVATRIHGYANKDKIIKKLKSTGFISEE